MEKKENVIVNINFKPQYRINKDRELRSLDVNVEIKIDDIDVRTELELDSIIEYITCKYNEMFSGSDVLITTNDNKIPDEINVYDYIHKYYEYKGNLYVLEKIVKPEAYEAKKTIGYFDGDLEVSAGSYLDEEVKLYSSYELAFNKAKELNHNMFKELNNDMIYIPLKIDKDYILGVHNSY